MAQKIKSSTKIPMAPKPTSLKNAKSISNIISMIGNTGLHKTKPPITKAPNLRRSKSMTDVRTLSVKPYVAFNKPMVSKQISLKSATSTSSINVLNENTAKKITDFRTLNTRPPVAFNKQPIISNSIRKPIKRPATTEPNRGVNKISKAEASKPVSQKIAPYDYKGRYNQLKAIHDKLKVSHREIKEELETTADQNEELLTKTSQLEKDFDSLQALYENLKKSHRDLKEQHETTSYRNEMLQTKCDKLEHELQVKTELLTTTTNELKELREIHDTNQTQLSLVREELKENLIANVFMKEQLYVYQDEKRKMHNIIQELKGNIRVFCRIRPALPSEEHKLLYDINYLDETSIEMYRAKEKKNCFSFDQVFSQSSTQSDVYEELSQLVQSALDGYNVCVFAYGQTGSGKTYTMEGENDYVECGMIPRSIDTIFVTLQNLKHLGWVYNIQASFLEIYNENIVDLLDPKNSNLDIKMCDAKGTDVYVHNLTVEDINSAEKLKTLMKIAQNNRAVAATENNERSSRSHSVTKIHLEGFNEGQGQRCIGNLNLIDLAGSEKFSTNEITRLRETTNINKSLSNLSNVILALSKKTSHVPYRNSKLTHLLMPSLGGNSKTLMLVNISPLDDCYSESVNSLRFASSVNQCKTGTIKKQKTHS